MATLTHTRGDTLPLKLALPPDATAAILLVHAAHTCVEIDGEVARSRASFDPAALASLPPGRVYRTSVRITHADGASETIDAFALRIEDGCTSSFYAPSIPTV